MIRLTCLETSTEDLPFNIVKGQDYDPIDCKEIDGTTYYLIHKQSIFGYWYEERMFSAVHYDDAELDKAVKEAQDEAKWYWEHPLNQNTAI